jgi:ferredoxin
MKIPVVELSLCTLCGGCIEVSPSVFSINEAGFLEVAELETYPVEEVDEAIMYCPEDAIYWEEA